MLSNSLSAEYRLRFTPLTRYRKNVWKVLVEQYFQSWIRQSDRLLDLGCGWGEFINQVQAKEKYAIDLNSEAKTHLNADVAFINQSCAERWPFEDNAIDAIFTSNFLEHLLTKDDLLKTLSEAHRSLKKGGLIICLGPNIKYTGGDYWDFFDHHIPLSEASLSEALQISGFQIKQCLPKFLPYTMSDGKQVPMWCIALYLRLPFVWPLLGKQFLVIAQKL